MFHYQVSSCLSTGVGSRVHAEPLQSRSRVVRTEHILNAKTVQSGCIPLEWLQTRCKPNAKTVQSVPLCSDLPRALPPIWEAASMDQARRTPARGAETAGKDPRPRPDSWKHYAGFRCADPTHLNALPARQSARKSAQIRWLWPEISEALAAGHTIGDIRRELALDGLEISYSNLRTHVARLRRSRPLQPIVNRPDAPTAPPPTNVPAGASPAVPPTNPASCTAEAAPYDPLANLRDRLTRRPGFQYDDRPPDEGKLI